MTKKSTEPAGNAESAGSNHRIVVGVDGSEIAMRALDWAAAEPDRAGAVLEIHTAYELGYEFITHDEVLTSMGRRVEEAVSRVAELAPRVTTTRGMHEESPEEVLIEASDGADLLVVGSRGLGGFKGLLLGSVSQKCCLRALSAGHHPRGAQSVRTRGNEDGYGSPFTSEVPVRVVHPARSRRSTHSEPAKLLARLPLVAGSPQARRPAGPNPGGCHTPGR